MSDIHTNINAVEVEESNLSEPSTITMLNVLEEVKEIEQEYAAKFGGSDEETCTYAKGALKRQALYSCLTCNPDSRNDLTKCAGVCHACSYRCHEKHDLIKLHTKRNFRCDCPTLRCGGDSHCTLNPELVGKQPENAGNQYNQNFQGMYCKCMRAYPDTQRTTEDIMLQCVICEDWFDLPHLQTPPAVNDKWLDACIEMICDGCMERHEFLRYYAGLAMQPEPMLKEANMVVNGEDTQQKEELNKSEHLNEKEQEKLHENKQEELNESDQKELNRSKQEKLNQSEQEEQNENEPKKLNGSEHEKLSQGEQEEQNENEQMRADESDQKEQEKLNESEQKDSELKKLNRRNQKVLNYNKLEKLSEEPPVKRAKLTFDKCRRPKMKTEHKDAVFFATDWRNALCTCANCLEMYKKQCVLFLIDIEDSSKAYEEVGMKDKNKKDYFKGFATAHKLVIEEDIKRFFAGMRDENTAAVGQPPFCP